MRKTYLAKRNALLSSREISWGVTVGAVFALVLVLRFFAPNFFWKTVSPLYAVSGAAAASTHGFFSIFGDAAALTAKNESLTQQNAALASENRALTKQLAAFGAIAQSGSASGVFAGVVARPPESPYDTLMLAAGAKDGVTVGMEAFGVGGTPIGVVSSVLGDFSQVTLWSAPGLATSGWVGHANTPLTIIGSGGGTLRASVPRSANIGVGDIVYVPGPGMLPIGTVARTDGDSLSPSITLRITPAVNPFSIGWVDLRATGITMPILATSTTP